MKSINEALKALDTKDDSLWTDDGLPTVDAVAKAVGRPVSRGDVTAASPRFTRHNPVVGKANDAPEPEVETPAPEPKVETPVEDGMGVDETLAEFDRRLKTLNDERARVQAEIDDVTAARSDYVTRVVEPYTHQSDQEARMRYIRTQHEANAAKHASVKAALNGIDPSKLVAKSPLDAAMSRKTSRGMNRPSHPSRVVTQK